MSRQIIQYKCLLISPSDVTEERNAVIDVVLRWNAQIGANLGVNVEIVRWETHSTPDMSDKAQNIINAQIVEDCDLGIAVFWSRIGTATDNYASGSVEEINKLLQKKARVMVYFSEKPIPQNALRDSQFYKLQEIRKQYESQGLLSTFADIHNFREQINLHLTSIVSQLVAVDRKVSSVIPSSGTVTAPTPDVRVIVQTAVSLNDFGNSFISMSINVQNHSPQTVFTGNVLIETKTNEWIMVPTDFITHERQHRRELRSGESFSFHIGTKELDKFENKGLICAVVKDDIDRTYRSDPDSFRLVLLSVKN